MKKVLVVEDSIFVAEAIKVLLSSHDISVEHLSDGSKVLDKVVSGKFDLVLLDLMMPMHSGTEAILILKKDERTRNIPVIILTAKTDALKWDKELSVCDSFMTKSFNNRDLVSEVLRLLGKK